MIDYYQKQNPYAWIAQMKDFIDQINIQLDLDHTDSSKAELRMIHDNCKKFTQYFDSVFIGDIDKEMNK